MRILITGSCGLVGGEAVAYFGSRGHKVVGIDNQMRGEFFGKDADPLWNLHRVAHVAPGYEHHSADIRDPNAIGYAFRGEPYDAVIHCAAQPSHDYASTHVQLDYEVNVLGTKNMLEATWAHSPNAVFIFMSTNKVYDNAVNNLYYVVDTPTRFDVAHWDGFNESTEVGADNAFGQHKLEADQMVQNYARLGLKTVVFRGGCLTGPGHSGTELHGFLSYIVKCAVTGKKYTIYGYGGKQVRDNIHSYDICTAFEEVIKAPRAGEVYNLGGGPDNSTSVLEAIATVEALTGRTIPVDFGPARDGDHRHYVTDMSKFRSHYPNWKITKSLYQTLQDMVQVSFWGRYCDHEDTRNFPLTEKSVVWDVGGFRGSWTESISQKYNPHVYIYEPVKEFAEACQWRFRLNDKVFVRNYGLGPASGRLMIARQEQNTSLIRGGEGQRKLTKDITVSEVMMEEIEIADLYQELSKHPGEVDLISFNCEGAEYDLLDYLIEKGGINRFKYVQIQFHNFFDAAPERREGIRKQLARTHTEIYNYPWTWEAWKRKERQ